MPRAGRVVDKQRKGGEGVCGVRERGQPQAALARHQRGRRRGHPLWRPPHHAAQWCVSRFAQRRCSSAADTCLAYVHRCIAALRPPGNSRGGLPSRVRSSYFKVASLVAMDSCACSLNVARLADAACQNTICMSGCMVYRWARRQGHLPRVRARQVGELRAAGAAGQRPRRHHAARAGGAGQGAHHPGGRPPADAAAGRCESRTCATMSRARARFLRAELSAQRR